MTNGGAPLMSDDAEPRAPSQGAWEAMTPEERERAVLALPASAPVEPAVPEGDAHRRAKCGAVQALESFFRRIRRSIYVSSDLAVYYPDEPRFQPDILVVLGVPPGERVKWVVSAEGKGIDLAIDVHLPGYKAPSEDGHERRLERYAALGIAEYFVVDRERRRLRGYRLSSEARAYEVIEPEEGRLPSRVLGLDIMVQGAKLRFFCGTALLPEADELIARLSSMLNEAMVLKEDAERRADDETHRADMEARRADEAVQKALEIQAQAEEDARHAEALAERAELAEQRLAEALSELHKLKGWE